MDKRAILLGVRLFSGELPGFFIEVDIAPQAVSERCNIQSTLKLSRYQRFPYSFPYHILVYNTHRMYQNTSEQTTVA